MTPSSLQRLNLGFGQRARFAFERDFLGLRPIDVRAQAIDERMQLAHAEERRRASAEVDESKRASTHDRLPADEFDLAGERRKILFDLSPPACP